MNNQNNYKIALCDTDSIFFSKQDGSKFTIEERKQILDAINSTLPEYIKFGDNGYNSSVLVVKAKNYVFVTEEGKIKYKGSGILATNKEKKFKVLIKDIIGLLLEDKPNEILGLYHKYVKQVLEIKDISEYCSKKTITKSVLNPKRKNESKVLDAVIKEEHIQEGDKVYCYFDTQNNLKLQQNWTNDHSVDKLLNKLYKTVLIFNTLIDTKEFINYSLKTKKSLLEKL